MVTNLISVYDIEERYHLLWSLLLERTEEQSISHKGMPEFEKHVEFVDSHPYSGWYFIENGSKIIGSIYITQNHEIGISVFNKFQGKGYGTDAVRILLMRYRKGRFLANINPKNENSIAFFKKLGFKHIQNTYEVEI